MLDYSESKSIAAHEKVKERDFWLDKLSGDLEKSFFTYDFNKGGSSEQYKTGTMNFSFSEEIASKLTTFSNKSDYTLYIILTAGLVTLLGKYTGLNDIIVGSPICKQEVDGEFINTLLTLRSSLREDMTFKELLMMMKDTVLEATENQNYPIETLLYKLGMEAEDNECPLFDVVVMLDNIHDKGYIRPMRPNMVFAFSRTGDAVGGVVDYNASLYARATIEKIIRHLKNLFQEALFQLDSKISGIGLLSDRERKQILFEFNDTKVDLEKDKCYHRLFEDSVASNPEKKAAEYNGLGISYQTLNEDANRIAHYLKDKGIKPGAVVAICMNRSINMLTAIIGIFKAGAAYLPLEPDYPGERIKFIIENGEVSLVITQPANLDTFNQIKDSLPHMQHILCLENQNNLDYYSAENLESNGNHDDLAYLIYTSGTTGKPKGVMIHQLGMINHIYAKIADLSIVSSDIIAQTASACFDISVWQFLAGLVVAAKTFIIDREVVLEPGTLLAAIKTGGVTILETVPSLATAFLEMLENETPASRELRCLRWMMLTGEALSPNLVREWFKFYPGIPVVNAYGPTEASDDVTHHILHKSPQDILHTVPVGKPIQNIHVYVMDKNLMLCPAGVKGEIYVAGIGVGKGYWKDAEKTGKAFLPNPYVEEIGDNDYATLYKTGDLGYFRDDGALECLGRVDFQVKIRGNRIELGEIENQLLNIASVSEAVVIVKNASGGNNGGPSQSANKYLCAYIVAQNTLDGPGLKDLLSTALPSYMIPSHFVFMDKMPLNSSGKIDRKKLPEPEFKIDEDVVAPRNALEIKLAGIWSDILSVEEPRIHIDSNFFEFGGHSLNATQLATRIHKEFNVKIPLFEIFKTPTISGLRKYIEGACHERFVSIEPVETKEYYAISSAQKRIFVLQQLELESTVYNSAHIIELEDEPDKSRMAMVFSELIRRHESLRTSFEIIKGEPVQRVQDTVDFEIENYELEGDDTQSLFRVFQRFIRPFNLGKAPLFRAGLLNMTNGNHILMVDMHHIINDGVSEDILKEDYLTLYEGMELPPLNLQYKDYSQWQAEQKGSEELIKQEAFWVGEFSEEVPLLDLPIDFPRPAVQSFEGNSVDFRLNKDQVQSLYNVARLQGATSFMVFLAVFNVFLAKICNREDILVGVPAVGRNHADLEPIIGMLVNTLVLRNKPLGHHTFTAFLNSVKEKTLKAFENQEYQFEDLVEKVGIERDSSRNPLFSVWLVLNEEDNWTDETPLEQETEDEKPSPYSDAINKTSKFDLTLFVNLTAKGAFCSFEYCTALFKPSTIHRFVDYFKTIVDGVFRNPDTLLSEIEIITRTQREQIYHSINEIHISPEQTETGNRLPASYHQERLWFIDKFERGSLYESSPVYHNIPSILKLTGPLDCHQLEQCIQATLQRHGILRTGVITVSEKPFQLIRPHAEFQLKVTDLPETDSGDVDKAIALAIKESQTPFLLERDLLIRGTLIRVNGIISILVLTLHHIIADRASLHLLAEEILLHYRAISENKTPPSHEPSPGYSHFSQWQRQLPQEIIDYWMSYWKRELQGKLQPMELATDRPRAAVHIYQGRRQKIILPPELNLKLNRFCQDNQTHQKLILLAVFKVLLNRYTGHDEIVLGHSLPNRLQQESRPIIGPLANLIVLRSDLSGSKTFSTLLNYLDHKLDNAGKYQGLPFDKLVLELNPDKDMSRTALFDVLFQYDDEPLQLPPLQELQIELIETNLGWGKYDLNLSFIKKDGAVSGVLVYNGDYYNDSTISRMIQHYLTLLKSSIENPELPVSTQTLLTEEERNQILVQFNNTEADYPETETIPQLIEEKVQKYPRNTAVEYEGDSLSYEQLNQRSQLLAQQLLEIGIEPNQLVAMLMKPSLEMLIGIFGILKSGGAYLPIDPDYPQDRINYMLTDSATNIVVTDGFKVDGLENLTIIDISNTGQTPIMETGKPAIQPNSLAYVIYTSGTTGQPKGVMIEHRNIVRLFFNDKCLFDFTSIDTWTLFHSYSFDFSVWEIFGALLYGGRLIVIPKTVTTDPEKYLGILKDRQVTVLNQTPVAFYQLSDIETAIQDKQLALRYVIFGGEALQPAKLKAWKEKYPDTKLINMYGITETTVHVTYKEVTSREIEDNACNIGVPLPTLTTYVVDRNLQLLPIGIPGELLVGGEGVSRGYLGKPRLTEQKFIDNPYKPGDTLYRSGDLVKLLENGEMEYLGRIDDQVKIRGYRIELGEIQAQLKNHQNIKEAVVVMRRKEKEEPGLCAYIVSEHRFTVMELREYLSAKLPHYMIPSQFVHLDKLPVTAHGKVDKRALPEPDRMLSTGVEYTPPENEVEKVLAKIWAEVLDIDEPGINDDFFDLGGNSIKLVKMYSLIDENYPKQIKVQDLFDYTTIKKLAVLVQDNTIEPTPKSDTEIKNLDF